MIVKTIIDFKRPGWSSYGNVHFFDVPSLVEGDRQAREALLRIHPDAEVVSVDVRETSQRAWDRHLSYLEDLKTWREYARSGKPQPKRI